MLHHTANVYFVQDQGGAIFPANLWRRDHGPAHHYTLKEALQHAAECREHISDSKLPFANKTLLIRQETICSTMIEAKPFAALGKWVLVKYEMVLATQFRFYVDGTPEGTAHRNKALQFQSKNDAYNYKQSREGRALTIHNFYPVFM